MRGLAPSGAALSWAVMHPVPGTADPLQPDPLVAAKAVLRRELRARRQAMTRLEREAEAALVAAACLPLLEEATALASYQALREELDTDRVTRRWWAAGRVVWLPRVSGPRRLAWHPVADPRQLRIGAFGIREPDPGLVDEAPLPADAVVLVPGLGYSAAGWRLGMGGGFYDAVLATHPGPTIGLAFACQRLDEVPREAHDRPVQRVLFGG